MTLAAAKDAPAPIAPAIEPSLTGGQEVAPNATHSPDPVFHGVQFCENCGSKLAIDDVFCCECGARNEPLNEAGAVRPISPATKMSVSAAEPGATPRDVPPAAPDLEQVPVKPATVAADQNPASVSLAKDILVADEAGDALPGFASSPASALDDSAGTVFEDEVENEPDETSSSARGKLALVLGAIVLLTASGAGYVYRDRLTAVAGLDKSTAKVAQAGTAKSDVPRVAGTYLAFLMD
ncbi:MAG: hypothetical protein ACOVKV_15545, partial [Novosphingobium sp.]